MSVPRVVREQAKRAEELHRQHYQPQDTDEPEPPEPPALENEEIDEEEHPDSAPSPEPQPSAEDGDWEERYRKLDQAHRALQGKYNAEVPRLTRDLREARAQLEQAQRQTQQAETEADEARKQLQGHLDRVRDEYGADLADALASVAHTARNPQQDTQPADTGDDPNSRFWRHLLRRVPDFEQVNVDPQFIQWLQTASPRTGLTYQQELNEAGHDLDAQAVADLVAEFKRAQAPKPQRERAPAKDPETQVAAPRKRTRREPVEKPRYTPADYQRLQDEIRRGRWRGRETEARALEAEIHAALFGSQS